MNYFPLFRTIYESPKFRTVMDKHGGDGVNVWVHLCGRVMERIERNIFDFHCEFIPGIAAAYCCIDQGRLAAIIDTLISVNLVQLEDDKLYILQLAKYLSAAAVSEKRRKALYVGKKQALEKYSAFKSRGGTGVMTYHDAVMTYHDAVMTNHDVVMTPNLTEPNLTEPNVNTLSKLASEISDVQAAPKSNCPYKKIIALYHEILPSLASVERANETRQAHIKARHREPEMKQDLNNWRGYFEYVAQSKFLMGLAPPSPGRTKPFTADFDFLIGATNYIKILEGKYHD